jgi:hypothetical protein
MEKKLMWFAALLLTMLVTTMAVQYFVTGNINPFGLLGVVLGAAIGWTLVSDPRKSWTYSVGMLFWVVFVPAGFVGLVGFIASLLAIKFPAWGVATIYLLGVLIMLFFFIHNASRSAIEGIYSRPMVDERYQYHFGLSGFWAFLFVNLLIIGALLQPWVSRGQLGLWIGVLIASLVFWGANLLILERKR